MDHEIYRVPDGTRLPADVVREIAGVTQSLNILQIRICANNRGLATEVFGCSGLALCETVCPTETAAFSDRLCGLLSGQEYAGVICALETLIADVNRTLGGVKNGE